MVLENLIVDPIVEGKREREREDIAIFQVDFYLDFDER